MTSASRPYSSSAPASERMFPTDLAIFSPASATTPLCIQIRASGLPRAASVCHVRGARLDRGLDEFDDRPDGLARLRLAVGAAEPEAVGVGHVLLGHLAGELVAGHPRLPRGVVDLVVHVGDVGDEGGVVAL